MRLLSLFALSTILLAPPYRAQEAPDPIPPGPAPALETPAGLIENDEGLFGVGPGYRARFDGAGFELLPVLGPRAERAFPVRFELESIRRGARTLLDAAGATGMRPLAQGRRVEAALPGGITACYDVLEEGVEQSFRFESRPPGSGDLVVRGRLSTDLAPTRTGARLDGLRLELPGVGAVELGAVTGIAADGATAPGWMGFDGTHLELVLPGSFVDGAALPLVLDPLITVSTDELFSSHPDVAYDRSSNRYIVVTEVPFALGLHEVRYALYDANGTMFSHEFAALYVPGSPAAGIDLRPKVANVNLRDHFVICYSSGGDIVARSVSAHTGDVSEPVYVASGPAVESGVDVSGDATLADDDALAVWSRPLGGHTVIEAAQIEVAPGGELTVHGWTQLSFGSDDVEPAISKSGGAQGRHLVVWRRDGTDLRGALVDRDLNPIDSYIVIDSGFLPRTAPDCDGDGDQWVVVYEREELSHPGSRNVRAESFVYVPGSQEVAALASRYVASDAGQDESGPSVAFLGNSYLIGYHEDGANGTRNAYVRSVQSLDCLDCEGEFSLVDSSYDLGVDSDQVAIGSKFHGDANTEDEALIALRHPANHPGFLVVPFLFDAADGLTDFLGGGCGVGGRAVSSCVRVGNGNFTQALIGAEPLTDVFLLVSTPGAPGASIPCAPCTLFVDPDTASVLPATTDARGVAQIATPISNYPALIGLHFEVQWLVKPHQGPGPCSASFAKQVDLSSALTLVFEP